MTRSAALVSVCVISIAVSSSPTSAAEDCFKALIQDRVKFDLHDTRALAITELIRQNTSESDNAEAKYGAFGASRSRQKAANFFSDTTGKYNSERIESLATQTLSKNAVIAYRECVRGKKDGPIIAVHDARANAAPVPIRWTTPPGAKIPADGEVSFDGGTPIKGFPPKWSANKTHGEIVRRQIGQDLRVVANIGDDSDNVFIAAWEDRPPPPEIKPVTQLYAGTQPNRNASEVTVSPNHKSGTTKPYGYTASEGIPLYTGVGPANAGSVLAIKGTRGPTKPIGFAIPRQQARDGDHPLYVGAPNSKCSGVVADYQGYLGCSMELLGYSLEPSIPR